MKKAIFIDRDGTLIKEVGYLTMIDDLEFTKQAPEALKIFSSLGYLNILITNQSAIARGLLSPKQLNKIHAKLKALLQEEGATIDGVFFCPHFAKGRVAPYNVQCDCRKPNPGLVLKAKEKHHIDLQNSFLVGDKITDIQLAHNAGVRPVLVLTGYGAQTRSEMNDMENVFPNLYEFAQSLMAGN